MPSEVEDDICERLGHQDEYIHYEDDEVIQWWCRTCGAEWEEEKDAPAQTA